MKMTKGVHHVAIKAKGLEAFEKTMHFYRDILGMEILHQWGEGENIGVMVDIGGGSVMEIFANASDEPGQGALRHIAFATDDVDGCVKKVEEAGYEITIRPKDIKFATVEPYSARIAFCIGPVGEEIEFFHEVG